MQPLAGGPASAQGAPSAKTVGAANYGVGIARCAFIDRTRSTPNFDTTPPSVLSRFRTLVTEIRYPTDGATPGTAQSALAPAARIGGFPMIVFAHGYDVTPDIYGPLLDAWVRAGFVVAAPFFPDEQQRVVTAQHGVNTEDDMWNEPADLAFVTRQLLAASATSSPHCRIAHGLIRPSQLALVGHSDGATVVGMLSFARGRDPYGVSYQRLRAGLDFRATIILSGQQDGVDPYLPLKPDPALLVVQSAADQCNPASKAIELYRSIRQRQKWFLELRSAHHLPPFDGVDVAAFDVVARTSIRFLRIALEGAKPTVGLLAYANTDPAIASMYQGPNAPSDPAPTGVVSCGLN
ncbi:MAG TPA: hypothetical protein VMV53_09170 [Acidimicrobiales bacterium]|nr:hypothetical protein [Acidimicrobiales bacterium]